MKRILFNITLLLLVSYSGVSFSQIRKLKPIDEFLIKEDIEDLLISRGGPCAWGGRDCENIDNFTFTSGSSFDNTLANHNSVVRAAAISHRNWFNGQKDIMKKHLENKFGQNFSNYDVAKNKMFFHSEVKNLVRVSIPVRTKYSNLKSNGFNKQRIHKKELKLLKFRESEIKAGKINNSVYGNVKVGNTYLKDIKDLNTIKSKWNPLVADFSKNTATTHINNYIYKEVGLHNNDLIAGVVNLKNNYYNRFNDWDKLDLVQFLINFEQIKNLSQNYVLLASSDARLLMDKNSGAYQSNEKMVEDSAIKNRKGGYSIFDNWWIGYYAHHYPLAGQPNYEYGAYVVNELRTKRLNELLGETSIGANASVDFIVEKFHISDKYQLIWLNDNPAKAIEIKNSLGSNPTTSNPTFIASVLPQLQNGAIIAKFLEELNIDKVVYSDGRFLYENENITRKLIEFVEDNKVNGGISARIHDFVNETVRVFSELHLTDANRYEKFKGVYDRFDPVLSTSTDRTVYESKIREYATSFKQWGNKEFGNYLENLLPLDSSFSDEDYRTLYETIREKARDLVWDYLRAIAGQTYESFKPVIEMALWEVGGGVALKILSKLPFRYLTTPIKNVIARLKTPTSTAFTNLKHAKKYGIQSYKKLGETFKELGISARQLGVEKHHLFEKRFVNNLNIKNKLGSNTDDWLSIVVEKTNKLTESEHYKFTQSWKNAIPYKNSGSTLNTLTATWDDVVKAAKEIYKDYPEILKALGL